MRDKSTIVHQFVMRNYTRFTWENQSIHDFTWLKEFLFFCKLSCEAWKSFLKRNLSISTKFSFLEFEKQTRETLICSNILFSSLEKNGNFPKISFILRDTFSFQGPIFNAASSRTHFSYWESRSFARNRAPLPLVTIKVDISHWANKKENRKANRSSKSLPKFQLLPTQSTMISSRLSCGFTLVEY